LFADQSRNAGPCSGIVSAHALAAVDVLDLAGHEARGLQVENRLDDDISPGCPTGLARPVVTRTARFA
ncbi:MAG: hypothetical protein WBL84_22285, partial [Xanthobacteraceae bacterium]